MKGSVIDDSLAAGLALDIFTAVEIHVMVFWVMTLYRLVGADSMFKVSV
jgi:hypothetical protein